MKRIKLSLTVLAALFAAIFTSCDKDVESSSVELNLDKTADIKVYVYADLNKTQAGLERAPSGTMIKTQINYADYKTGVAGAFQDTVAVGANGIANITVPADDDGITVTLTPVPFEANQVQPFGSYDGQNPILKIFIANSVNVNVTAGDVKIQQIVYNTPEDFKDFVPMVTISGYITAELNDTIAGSEDLEMSVRLTFHTSEWYVEEQTNSAGEFSNVEVPAGTEIFVTCEPIVADFYNGTEDDEFEYEYELKAVSIGSFTAITEDVIVDFGDGIPVEE